ncbi:MAG: FAD-binding oxidoreductase [Acetobacteraceae bacterium]|nr:FAD-binding oxidoreductase [Acetobacteraceae bacterium]
MTEIVTLDGTRANLSAPEISGLRDKIRGRVVLAGDTDYEAARRVWNGNVDRRPALIARCAGIADVQNAVRFASTHGLLVSVRGGGHSAPGYGTNDGGMVIDLSPMKAVNVDPARRVARAEGGVLWGEFDAETQVHGLATTGGTVSNTGVAGLTLGGGLGWLMGKYGASVDNLIAADVVTADGQVRHASATENPDLFWALRGGGGNFGVVTALRFRLHPVTQVLGGLVLHPLERAADMLRFYRDFCPALPDEAEAYAALLTSPDGIPMAGMLLGYNGPIEDGERILAPARKWGRPAADLVAPMPYNARQSMLDAPNAEHGLHRYWRSAFTEQISDDLIKIVVEGAHRFSSPLSALFFFYLHGALTRVPANETAFGARRAQWDFDAIGQWTDGSESASHIAWVREIWRQLEPHLQGSAYINHIAADDQPEKVRASFGENHQRLRAIKAKYDKANLFRVNSNIPPA